MKQCGGCQYWPKEIDDFKQCDKGINQNGCIPAKDFYCKFHRKIRTPRTEKKKLKDVLDSLFSKWIIYSGGLYFNSSFGCWFLNKDSVTCGGMMQCNHIISRGNYRLRWDEANACRGCAGHNLYYEHHEGELHDLIRRLLPAKWEDLQQVKHQKADLSKGTLTLLKLDLERKLRGVK